MSVRFLDLHADFAGLECVFWMCTPITSDYKCTFYCTYRATLVCFWNYKCSCIDQPVFSSQRKKHSRSSFFLQSLQRGCRWRDQPTSSRISLSGSSGHSLSVGTWQSSMQYTPPPSQKLQAGMQKSILWGIYTELVLRLFKSRVVASSRFLRFSGLKEPRYLPGCCFWPFQGQKQHPGRRGTYHSFAIRVVLAAFWRKTQQKTQETLCVNHALVSKECAPNMIGKLTIFLRVLSIYLAPSVTCRSLTSTSIFQVISVSFL